MKRESWVLCLLLVALLARSASAAVPEIYAMVDADSSVTSSSANMSEHAHPCATEKDAIETPATQNCCSGEDCDADCKMAGCLLLTLPGATIQFQVPIPSGLYSTHLITFPNLLHFPFLRPPIA